MYGAPRSLAWVVVSVATSAAPRPRPTPRGQAPRLRIGACAAAGGRCGGAPLSLAWVLVSVATSAARRPRPTRRGQAPRLRTGACAAATRGRSCEMRGAAAPAARSRRPCGGAPRSLAWVVVSVAPSAVRRPRLTPRGQAPRLRIGACAAAPAARSRRPCGGAPRSLAWVVVSVAPSAVRRPRLTPRGQAPRLRTGACAAATRGRSCEERRAAAPAARSRRPCGGAPRSLAWVVVSVATSAVRRPRLTPRGQAPRLRTGACAAAPYDRSRRWLCPWRRARRGGPAPPGGDKPRDYGAIVPGGRYPMLVSSALGITPRRRSPGRRA